MTQAYSSIAYTKAVQSAQQRYGTREQNARVQARAMAPDGLGPDELSFIAGQDGFYMATVNEDGWPYVQFRGGPKGFLKAIDKDTLGYADFRGNLQYISVGNLGQNDRVALILMDYANKVRLKIYARASIVDAGQDPKLIESLQVPSYNARIERAVLLRVEAFNWNCQQHITARYTLDEIEEMMVPIREHVDALEKKLADLGARDGDLR